MTAYLDTSSLVKLFVDEAGSDTVRALRDGNTALATAVVAYAEARAAFAGMRRGGALSPSAHRRVIREFEREWLDLAVVPVDLGRCRIAGQLAEQHALRGFDGVHLACYLALAADMRPAPVTFSSFDARLMRAAAAATRLARRRSH